MQNVVKTFIASASELQTSDIYMTVKATLFTVPEANLNGVRCTSAFMDEIIEHADDYNGLPLCADIATLAEGRYDKLGHCYDPDTDTFATSIIGSFYRFEKEEIGENSWALVGYARVPKRNKAVCKALSELFVDNALKFSFEISCGEYSALDDGTILIDASEKNYLEGMCVVSFPACPDAVAMQLVAEIMESNDKDKEAVGMNESTVIAEQAAENENIELQAAENTAETHTEEAAEAPVVAENDEAAEDNKETAALIVHESHSETEHVNVYDTDTGEEVSEFNSHEVCVSKVIETPALSGPATPGPFTAPPMAEAQEAPVVAEDECEDEDEHEDKHDELAELRAEIEALKTAIAELKAQKEEEPAVVVAAANAVNPMVDTMTINNEYALLEKADTFIASAIDYSLLEKA